MGKIIKMQFCPCGTKNVFIISRKRGRFKKKSSYIILEEVPEGK